MRKGDEKKQEILSVSDRLFCSKGFEATSIQDILDQVHTSKGGFYHHFVSKDAVLDVLCAQRAEKAAKAAEEAMQSVTDHMRRINLLFYYMTPLRRDELNFMAMLMPLLDKPESLAVRVRYQDALIHAFLPMLEREVYAAKQADMIYPAVREVCQPVLLLVNQCWLEAALQLLQCAKAGQKPEVGVMLGSLDKYRRSVEVLLDAPYGSVQLVQLGEWAQMLDSLMRYFHYETPSL